MFGIKNFYSVIEGILFKIKAIINKKMLLKVSLNILIQHSLD